MFCTSCGTKNAAENNFCRQCGHKLDRPTASAKISEETFTGALPPDEQVSALLERAYRQRRENDLPGAIALCEEALKLNPDSTSAHSLLGQLHEAGGNREQAIRQYERVLELNPGSIADRVKLDQLREETPPAVKTGIPRITLVDRDGTRTGSGMFLAIGVGLMLVLLGGVLALQFSNRTTGTARGGNMPPKPDYDTNRVMVSEPSASAGKTAVQNSSAANPASTTPITSGSGVVNPGSANPATVASSGSMQGTGKSLPPLTGMMPGGFQGAMPGGNSFAVNPVRPFTPSSPAPIRQAASAPSHGKPAPNTGSKNVTEDTDSGDSRIHVKAESDNETPIVIKVTPVKSNGQKVTDSGNGAGSVDNSTGRSDTAYTAGADSRAYIAMGQDKMNRGDYVGAITVFRKAIPGANDDAGYVFEQIGHCYKNRGENKSAITSYESAIQKYKDLISAGRQADTARNGIRACETGIKICSGE